MPPFEEQYRSLPLVVPSTSRPRRTILDRAPASLPASSPGKHAPMGGMIVLQAALQMQETTTVQARYGFCGEGIQA